MKVGASLTKKLNPKNLYKSFKDKMKDVCLFGKCFTGDTLVCTEKGYVPICEIKVGDLVLSREESTGETGDKKVEQISIKETHTIHSIEVDGNTVIKTTAYHPFYVEGQGWVSAINLKEGDCLITPDGVLCITKVEKERYEEPVSMYNFHVEDWVSYFVTELNIYVHNGKGKHIHGNKGIQNATEAEINAAKNKVTQRIDEIKDAMTDAEKSRTTYGVAEVKMPDGSTQTWVASAGKDGYVRPDIRSDSSVIKNKIPDATPQNRYNDAEQTLMREAEHQNAEILAMGATRPVCPACQEVIINNNLMDRIITPLK